MKKINLLGKRFTRLLIIKESGKDWLCKCDCGNEKVISYAHLKTSHSKSCGCLRKEFAKKPPGVAGFNKVMRSYRNNAKKRNLSFELTREQVKDLTQQSCFYCNIPPNSISKSDSKNRDGDYVYNGVDRVDSSGGYTIENCVPCCISCNARKSSFSVELMIKTLNFLGYTVI